VPEDARRGERCEVLVGGGDHGHVDGDDAAAADATESLPFDDTEHLRLMLAAHGRDLVEEDRAPVCAFEGAGFVEGAGKGAACGAEQLAFEVVFRDCRTIEDLERACCAR
jgi:hypothetical protein